MTPALLDGLGLARRLVAVRFRAAWNRSIRKASVPRRVGSVLTVAGTAFFLVFVVWSPQAGGLVVLSRRSLDGGLQETLQGAVGVGLLAYFAVLVYGSLLFSVSSLLLDRDLEMLLVSPRPVAAVLAAKVWVRIAGLFAVAGLVGLPLVFGLPWVTGHPLAAATILLALLAIPLVPVSLVSLAVLSVIRFVPANRGREVVALLGLGLAATIEIVNIGFNPAIAGGRGGRSQAIASLTHSAVAAPTWAPHGWAARAISDALFGRPLPAFGWTALLLGAGLLAAWISVTASARLYVNGWTDYAPRRRRRARAETAGIANREGIPLLLRLGVSSAALAVMTKDWRMRRRDLVMIIRMVLPVLALALFAARGGGALNSFTHIRGGPLAASIALVPVPFVTLGLATALGLTAMSMEGGAIWMYAVSPNGLSRVLAGKVLVAAPPVAGAALAAALFTETEVHPGFGWAVPAVALAAVFGASLAVVMVAVGGILPRFNWTDPRRMTSAVAAWAGLAMQVVMVAMVTLLLGVGLILGRLGWVPAEAGYGVGLLLAAAACVGVALAAISAAGARLSRIEYGRGIAEQSLS